MISAIDTNIIIALWDAEEVFHLTVLEMLDAASSRGGAVICGAVYGELLAFPGRTVEFINEFLKDTDITVDWSSSEAIWRVAGEAFEPVAVPDLLQAACQLWQIARATVASSGQRPLRWSPDDILSVEVTARFKSAEQRTITLQLNASKDGAPTVKPK